MRVCGTFYTKKKFRMPGAKVPGILVSVSPIGALVENFSHAVFAGR